MSYKRISPVPIIEGGTGQITLTNHGVLLGAGTTGITSLAAAATGTVLIGNTAADASFSATPSVTSITIANAPVAGTDGVNKTYVDAIIAGLDFKNSCTAATTATLNATYLNGVAGVGATLTNAGTLVAFSVDGVTPAITSRILVKDQSTTFQNGIYNLTTVGSGAVAWILTRALDYDTPAEIQPGDLVPVISGTVNIDTIWLETATVTTIGTDPVVFALFSQPGITTITGNTGGALTGSNITFTGGTTGLSFGGSGTTETLSGTVVIANGGTNATSFATTDGTIYFDGTRLVTTATGTTGQALVSAGAGVAPAYGTLPIAGGGTNATSMTTTDGVVYFDGTRLVTTAVGTATHVLTSNGAGVAPTFQVVSGGSGITTINADTGSVTGATVSLLAQGASIQAGTTLHFFVDGGTPTVIQFRTTDNDANTVIGSNTGSSAYVGNRNTGVGDTVLAAANAGGSLNNAFGANSLESVTTGSNNCAMGVQSLQSLVDGTDNIAIGSDAMYHSVSAADNIAIGGAAMPEVEGTNNIAIGSSALGALDTGNYNIVISGVNGGANYSGAESSNILIGAAISGTNAESNTCRIGRATGNTFPGDLNSTYIAGIFGITTVDDDAIPVLVSSVNQLGTVSSSIRFKENVQDMGSASSSVMSLRPVTFNYKSSKSKTTKYGLIAEEVLKVMPDMVVRDKDGELLTVKYHELSVLLLNEIQKLRSELDALKLKMGV